jgi:hypothetical protein
MRPEHPSFAPSGRHAFVGTHARASRRAEHPRSCNAGLEPQARWRESQNASAGSLANENGNRRATKQGTEENIGNLSANLSQTFLRLRRGSIDEELFDVIAGFNALSAKTHVSRYEPHD